VDLLIQREDNILCLCECKHTKDPFLIDKKVAMQLMHKVEKLKATVGGDMQIQVVMIASAGIQQNVWSDELIDASVCLSDFFQ